MIKTVMTSELRFLIIASGRFDWASCLGEPLPWDKAT